ncbi:MAG: SDR family oxidoreductase [Alphaproteobacteria bacterium]|nr:SDR family oxidoreductase [Alphaproteobacteria bacterium]
MAANLNGAHALVTGGGSGIGLAIARALGAEGARITLMGRDGARLDKAAHDLRAAKIAVQAVPGDVADAAQVARAYDRACQGFDAPGILVNNAGQAESAPFHRTDPVLWQRMLAVNLTGTYLCSRAALPAMLERGQGRIVNIASTAGLKGYAYVTAYCAAKHGVVGLTRALAQETAKAGVTVNAVCPGYTDTDMVAASVRRITAKTGRSADEARADLARANPQGRLIAPAEVAAAVLFLCGAEAGAITGQAIAISGGETP